MKTIHLYTDVNMIHSSEDSKFVENEFRRMEFDKDARWRISDINKDFDLCNTYPRFLILPADFKDEDLESVAKFRYFRRIPTAVWRHLKNGCFIVRSSQPTVGWFGWFRNDLDESLVQSYVKNTMPPSVEQVTEGAPTDHHPGQNLNDCDAHREAKANTMVTKKVNESVDNNEQGLSDQRRTLVEGNKQTDQVNGAGIKGDGDTVNDNGINVNTRLEQHQPPSNHSCQTTTERTQQKQHQENHNNNLQEATNIQVTNNGKTSTQLGSNLESEVVSNENSTGIQAEAQNAPLNGHGTPAHQNNSISPVAEATTTLMTSKMLIIDARSYAAAMANRAKGGGCECSEYYQRCEVQFMNLANIHSIRKSFHAIRSVCEAYSEQSNNWLSFLDNSRWLHHISGLLKSALLIVDTIDLEEKSILIHCSDGWDRTPQLVALAEIMLDPHYRTFNGFRTLIQREWLDFGHKFADRCGSNPCNEDPNERCPVFLQWLDCVQQLLVQYPTHFEFNSFYLDKLNKHTYSNVFGTFSHNSTQERILSMVDDRFLSLWSYFDSSRRRFKNEKYVESDEILRPSFKVRDLHFWKEVYLPPLRNQAPYMPIANNIDNKKFYGSLYIDELTRTVCK